MKKYIIPVILPYIKQKEELNKEKLEELIKKHLIKIEEMDEHCYVEVAFVGCDFTSLNQNIQEEILETLQKYIRMERIDSIRVSIRPNNINKKTIKMLKKYKVKTIELEVYSTNDYILKRMGMK